MAVLLQFTVMSATRDQFDEFAAGVGEAMTQSGGPPPGLMAHVVYPEDDGFVIADVWRTESDATPFVDEVLRPVLARVGLTASEAVVKPVWSFARP